MKIAPDSIRYAIPGIPGLRSGMFQVLFSCLMGLLLLNFEAVGQATLEFVPSAITVDPNTNTNTVFSVDINVAGTGDMDAIETYVTYDGDVLNITDITLGSNSLTTFTNQANDATGLYEFIGISLGADLAVGFTLVTLEFTVVGSASPSIVDFNGFDPDNPAIGTSIQLNGQDVLSATTPLTVTINSANTAPVVNITAPTEGADITRGQNFALTATVVDTEEPGLGSGLNWSSSDVAFSGSQSGLSITDQLLEPGPQTITASITDAGGLTGEDQITVNVSCPQVSFLSPLEAGNVVGTSVDVELDVTDLLFGTVQSPNEHLHFFINPPDVNNLDQSKRISTANDGPQTTFTFDENSGALAFDGNGNGVQLGVNTIVVVAAQANHTEFTCDGAKAIVNFTVNQANTAPVITIDPTASVDEGGNVSVPLNITDADGDNLTVTITSVSNEPQDLQSTNSGKQVDPFPTSAAGFIAETSISSAAGTYTSNLLFTPTFGDGGSNGDGNAVYTITVEVSDEDGNTLTETLDLTVNDVDQVVAEIGTTRIEAESFDEQGPDNTSPGNTSDNNGIGVEVDNGFTNIGFTNAGDFVEYEIDVETAGNYKLDLFVGVPGGANKGMEISSDGNLLTTFNPTATGGFGSYQIQSVIVALPAGSQTLRFDWVGATGFQFNMDYFEFSLSTAPVIAAVDDQEIDEGSTLNVPITVSGGDAPVTVGIVIYDKSVPGGINNPFTPAATVPASDYTFTETPSGSGNYVLDWPTGAADGKSYEARVTADDGINPVVEEIFQINVAQDILDVILARTFSTPITPYYGGNPPGGQFAIEPAGNIGWIDAGEFAEYLIDVPSPGAYDLRVNASKGNNAGGNPATLTVSEESGGGFASIGTLGVQNNGWPNFSDYTTTVIFTSAGLQRLRFDFGGGMNITEFEFTEASSTLPPVFSSNISDQFNLEGDSPAGLVAQASDPDGGVVTYSDNGTLPPGLSIDPNTGVISGTISAGAANGSPYAVVITATDDEPETATLEFQWTVTVPVSLPVCVNCGNQPGVTAFGRSFTAEQFLASAPANIFNKLSAPISGTAGGSGEEDLFQSETYDDPLVYAIPTGNGDFTVELYLVELYIGSAGGGSGLGVGDRVFNIDVEGQTENGIDLFSDYGPLVAATKTFAVTVADGILNINLDATTDNAKLAGFCITPTADFVANAAPTVTIDTQDDIVDCESDGEDVTLTASASDAEQGDLTATIIWKDENGAQVGTGPSLALLGLTATATYTAEVTDATPTTTTESITVNIIGNTPPSLTSIQANPSAITVGGGVSLSVVASDNEDDDNTLIVTWSSDLETANNGVLGTGLTLNPILTVEGTHTITASVTDACGIETTETVQVVVEPPVPCDITAIVVDNISSCDDNGTDTNLGDDTFTADITVTFNESAPTTGNLVLGDEATGSVPVGDIVGNSYTFTGVTMPADGTTIIVSAEFSDEPTCELTNINAGTAPEACSVVPCELIDIVVLASSPCNDKGTPEDPSDDTFIQFLNVTLNNAPAFGTLEVTGSGSYTLDLNSLTGPLTSIQFNVEVPADGAPISYTASILGIPGCSVTNDNLGNAPEPCSVPPCTISAIDVTNISACNNQTTADGGDDTFTADITVTFNDSAPTTGNLVLGEEASGSVPVADITGNSYTFVGVSLPADGTAIIVSASFSDDPTCAFTNSNAGTAPEACPCSDLYYADTDEDGYGDPNVFIAACSPPEGYVANDTDCDDDNGDVNPAAQEICNGIDDDCDGLVDDEDDEVIGQSTWYADTDEDGYGDPNSSILSCEQPEGYVSDDTDCDDGNGDVNPAAQEICNGIDDDCDGLVDDEDDSVIGQSTWYADTDEDGYGDPNSSILSCEQPEGYVSDDTDCDDGNGDVNPAAQEICNGIDDDCDGLVDDEDDSIIGQTTWYADTDEDGYGDPNTSIVSCEQPDGYVADDSDCDDGNGDVNPAAQEICNGIDDDCDGLVDDEDDSVIGQSIWYADTDEDGYGDPNNSTLSCTQPEGYVADDTDCDDSNGDVNPVAQEICNGIDDDCDGLVDGDDPSVIGTGTWYADTDEDGYGDPNTSVESCNQPDGYVANADDCNDNNGDVNPAAQEVCNGIDDDCDGLVDDEDDSVIGQSTWYADTDEDGYGDPNTSVESCNQPDGYVANDGDCDDGNGDVNPAAQEICNGIDDDCDGLVDDEDDSVIGQSIWYADTDEDSYGDPANSIASCNQPDGYVANDSDCDDSNGDVNPDAQEVCDGIDNDCDGLVDGDDPSVTGTATWYADTDEDGYGDPNNTIESCNQPDGYVANDGDCNDNNGDVNPDAQEVCNGIDDDCDGLVDDEDDSVIGQTTWYADTDEDGYGDPASSIQSCNQPDGYVANDGDCDDGNGDVNPAAQEICNGIDDDCDGLVDDEDDSVIGGATWYADTDGDGFGDPANSIEACEQPTDYVANDGDCDDTNGDVNPDAQEVCDGIDNDCDGLVDGDDPSVIGGATWYADTDGDGFGDPNNSTEACDQPSGFVANDGDCDDTNGDVNPDAQEVCDGIDNDCDGLVDDEDDSVVGQTIWYADTDGDGYGDPANSIESCEQPTDYVANDGDCDDTNGDVNPDAVEVCNGIDDNCDGNTDEGVGPTWYADTDEDGYGDPANSIESCDQPGGYVANDGDCDDTNGDVNPDAQEVCNGIDDDCDGLVDSDDPSVIGGATWYADTDGDGYGDPSSTTESCDQPTGYVANADDCDDTNGDVNPDAQEVCNGIDDNCDGLLDEDDPSLADASTWYADTDGDGFGDPASSISACVPPAGYVANAGDCDDTDGDINPNAEEICDGIDNNCDGETDEDDVCVTCIDQVIDYNDFDDAWGIWNDGGTDCRLNDSDAPFAVGGTGRAVRLRDNTFSSVMTTDALDLSAYEDLKISFSFLTIGFDNILEDFWLQVSTDGSPNFTTIAEWDKGDEFENGIRYFEEVTLTGPFTSNMKFRFRCDASSDTDWLFIDNVEISGCFNPSALVANPDLENKTAKEGAIPFVSTDMESELETAQTNLQLFPNPVADELLVRFTMQETTDVTVMVTDLQGRRIGREQLLNAQGTIEQRIAVEQYPAGIYLLHLITPEGKQIQKFVVARN